MLHFTGYKQWRAIYFVSYMCYTVLHCYWHTMYHILLAAGCITQWWHMLMCCCVCLGQDVFLSCVLSQGSVDQVLMLFVVFLCSTEVYREDVFCVKHVTNECIVLCCCVQLGQDVFLWLVLCSASNKWPPRLPSQQNSRLLQFSKFSSAYNCVPNCVPINCIARADISQLTMYVRTIVF